MRQLIRHSEKLFFSVFPPSHLRSKQTKAAGYTQCFEALWYHSSFSLYIWTVYLWLAFIRLKWLWKIRWWNSSVVHTVRFTVVLITSFLWLLSSAVLSRSVMSDSLWPHGPQPSRLLCSWRFSRQEYWSAFPCTPPGDHLNPGTEPRSPALLADSLPSEPPGEPFDYFIRT